MEPAAESHPRIQTDGRGPGLKVGLLPGRHNPEAPADPEGAKVRLPDGGPGFVCDRFDDERRRRRPQPKRGQRGEAAPEGVEPPLRGHNTPPAGAAVPEAAVPASVASTGGGPSSFSTGTSSAAGCAHRAGRPAAAGPGAARESGLL